MASTSEYSASVDTGKVAGRRQLHYESLQELQADVQRLAQAEQTGSLKRLGNWTLGQALGHLAQWMEYAYTGVPLDPPFFIRWILRLNRKRFFEGPMRAGVKIPGLEGGTLGTETCSVEQGLARYQKAIERLSHDPAVTRHKIFGDLSREEYVRMNLRHAELHLSYFIPMALD